MIWCTACCSSTIVLPEAHALQAGTPQPGLLLGPGPEQSACQQPAWQAPAPPPLHLLLSCPYLCPYLCPSPLCHPSSCPSWPCPFCWGSSPLQPLAVACKFSQSDYKSPTGTKRELKCPRICKGEKGGPAGPPRGPKLLPRGAKGSKGVQKEAIQGKWHVLA